jgi:hypothetical protein
LTDPGPLRAQLRALERHRIRPLILLNANHGIPGPLKRQSLELATAAPRGARRVRLTRASAAAVVPHRTGFDAPAWADYKAAAVLITGVNASGTATLSKALPWALRAGRHPGSTLRFRPFGPPRLGNGAPNPSFRRTMRGWLLYVRAVTREVRRQLGSDRFDVEVWNELSFGSDFLYRDRYYDRPLRGGSGDVTYELVKRTARWLRDRRHRLRRVRIADGFASQTPFAAPSKEPPGVSALSKHPYQGLVRFPQDARFDGIIPLDPRRRPAMLPSSPVTSRRDRFVPSYDALFPEYYLSAIQTEHLVRDISPRTTDVYGIPHGRRARSRAGRAPRVWMTEMNLSPPDGTMTEAELEHIQAKATLRTLVSFVNKGVEAIHLFAVKGPNTALVRPSFFAKVAASNGAYPGADAAGETPVAVGRLVRSLSGSTRIRRPRNLSLISVYDDHDHRQFEGDGTASNPPLYNRSVLGFFPFQLDARRWIVPVYVMTRNMAQVRRPGDRGPSRFDLPPERYWLTIGGLPSGPLRVTATDPLTGAGVPVELRRLGRGLVQIKLEATDSPRLVQFAAP